MIELGVIKDIIVDIGIGQTYHYGSRKERSKRRKSDLYTIIFEIS